MTKLGRVTVVETSAARELLDALISAFAMLGGIMAYWSGFAAAQTVDEHPSQLAYVINLALARGFTVGAPAAILALIISLWS